VLSASSAITKSGRKKGGKERKYRGEGRKKAILFF